MRMHLPISQVEYCVSVMKLNGSTLTFRFFIPCAAVLLLYTQMLSIFTPRYVYMAALVVFLIGNAVSGSATSMTALLVGRAVSALGGAGLWK